MTVVKPTIQGKATFIPSDKEIADLQVKKAGLLNDITTAINELNGVHVKKAELEKKIEAEQKLYDSMVLQTTVEMQAELEKKISRLQNIFVELERQITTLDKEVKYRQISLQSLMDELLKWQRQIDEKKTQFKEEVTTGQNFLVKLKIEIENSRLELNSILAEAYKARLEATHAHTDMIAYRNQQADYAASLDRKARDLKIWEDRLMPAFKAKHPEGEMKFI